MNMLAGRLVAVSALALAAFLASPAQADEVHLNNGFTLKGRVDDRGDQLVVHTPNGRVWVAKGQVKQIVRRDTPGQQFERRRAALLSEHPLDLDGRVELAKWALARNLRSAGRRELRDVLAVEPNHAGARAALGYVRHEGAWVTPDEQKRLLGFVRDGGDWITADEAKLRRAKRLDALAAAQAAKDVKRTQAQTRKLEAETRLAEAQARVAEQQAERDRRWYASVILHDGGHHHGTTRRTTRVRRTPARADRCRTPGHRATKTAQPMDPHTRLRTAHQSPDDPHTRLRTQHRCDRSRSAPWFRVTFGTLAFRPAR